MNQQQRPEPLHATSEELEQIRVLSDNDLYEQACQFVANNGTLDTNKQLNSLVIYTQTWSDLENFVNRQQNREWAGRKYDGYREFYTALRKELNDLRQQVENRWFPPLTTLDTRAKRREWINYFSILVAREFIEHLAAENAYQERK